MPFKENKSFIVKKLRRRGDKLVKRLNEIILDKEPKHKVEKLKYKKLVKQPRIKNKSEFQLVNKPSWISPHDVLQSRLSMINKVYQFTSKEFQGEGIRGGRKREGELINFLSLKRGAYIY